MNHPKITIIGIESSESPHYAAKLWSLIDQPKRHAAAADYYGSSGYYCLAPGGNVAAEPVGNGDILRFATLAQKPDFLAGHPTLLAGEWVNAQCHTRITNK